MKDINQIRQLLKEIQKTGVEIEIGELHRKAVASIHNAQIWKIFKISTYILDLLPCETCNGSKQVPTPRSIGFGQENEIMGTCPDCKPCKGNEQIRELKGIIMDIEDRAVINFDDKLLQFIEELKDGKSRRNLLYGKD